MLLCYAPLLLNAENNDAATDTISASYRIDEVVVTGTKYDTDIRHTPLTVTTIEHEQLTENQRTNLLPTLMEQVPGLTVTSRGMMGYGVSTGSAGGMMLRGISSSAGQLVVLIDGHPQYNSIFGHGIGDSYQTLMTDQVEVIRGPASVIYGSNAMGGAFNIVTKKMRKDGSETQICIGGGSYGTVQAEAANQTKKGNFSCATGLQYNRSDNHRPNMGFEQYSGHVKIGYDLSKHWSIFANADITHFNSSDPGKITAPTDEAEQHVTRGVTELALENRYAKTNGRLSVYDNFGKHRINYGHIKDKEEPQTKIFHTKDAVAGIGWYQSATLFSGNRIIGGLDYKHIYGDTHYTDRKTGKTLDIKNKQNVHANQEEIAVYLTCTQDIAQWLTIDAGIRYDYHSVTKSEWIPQAGIIFRPIITGEMKLSASKGFRNPTLREMYLYPPSNEDLKPERLWNYEISWRQHTKNKTFAYGINIFYIKGDNIIQTVNMKNINTGEIENCGAEVDATWHINKRWHINTNHSYLHMKNPVAAAPTYKGYMGVHFKEKAWNVHAGLQQVCGLYTSAAQNKEKETFTLLNAGISYLIGKHITLWADGENLLAQRYEINAGYPMPKATFMGGIMVKF